MNANAIEIRGLEKRFKCFQLGPLDLTVPRGAVYGLIGPNGAGKTTTLDLIMGLGREDAGAVRVLGLDHRRDEVAMKRQVGYASPEVTFRAWTSVRSLLKFVRGFYPTWDDAYCEKLLTALSLGVKDNIRTLSLGTRIKLGLVVALAWRPKLLILDEPTVGLDPVSKQQIFSELLAAVQDEDRTVLISSQNLGDLERFADHVGMIKEGKLLLEGPMGEMVERFQMIDFITENGAFAPPPGVLVQQHDGNRWQALLDTRRNSLETMAGMGARQIATTPVTLEELFIALARK